MEVTMLGSIMEEVVENVKESIALHTILVKNTTSSLYLKSLRKEIIMWMVTEVSTYTPYAKRCRDTAIQIFNLYLSKTLQINSDPSLSTCSNLKLIALVCFVLSFKLNTAYMVNLDDFLNKASAVFQFTDSQLVLHEICILKTIDFQVCSLGTPSAIVRLLFKYSRDSPDVMSIKKNKPLLDFIDNIIADSGANTDCLLHASCTVAIAAVMFSCSMYHVHCSDWLFRIPDICFFSSQHDPSEQMRMCMDIDTCVDRLAFMHAQKQSIFPTYTCIPSCTSPTTKRKTIQDFTSVTSVADLSRSVSIASVTSNSSCDYNSDSDCMSVNSSNDSKKRKITPDTTHITEVNKGVWTESKVDMEQDLQFLVREEILCGFLSL